MFKGHDNSVFANTIWKFLERFFAQLVSLIVSIVLARILMPNDYGVVSIILVFITIANVFVTSGIATALIQKKDADELDFSTVLFFNLVSSVILYAILFILAPFIAGVYEEPLLDPLLKILSLKLIFAGFNSVQQAYVSRKMMFRKFFWATFIGTVVSGIAGIVCAIKGFGAWALAIQYLTNTVIDVIILQFSIDWKPSIRFSFRRFKSLWKFGWKVLFEGLSSTITVQLRSLIIGKVYTKSDLAYYSKAETFPSLIVNTISSSISPVLLSSMSKVQDNEDEGERLLRTAVSVSSFLIFPILIGLFAIADNFIVVLLTEKWADSAIYLRLFCITGLITVILIPSHQSLQSRGKSGVFMVEHMFARLCGLILLFIVYKESVLHVAITGLVTSLIIFITVIFTNKFYNHYSIKKQFIDIVPALFASIIMGVAVYFLNYLRINHILLLIIQVFSGAFIYVVLSHIIKPTGYKYIKKIIMSFFKRRKEQ